MVLHLDENTDEFMELAHLDAVQDALTIRVLL